MTKYDLQAAVKESMAKEAPPPEDVVKKILPEKESEAEVEGMEVENKNEAPAAASPETQEKKDDAANDKSPVPDGEAPEEMPDKSETTPQRNEEDDKEKPQDKAPVDKPAEESRPSPERTENPVEEPKPSPSLMVFDYGVQIFQLAIFLATFSVITHFIVHSEFNLERRNLQDFVLPAIVSVSVYFEKKRAFATGIAVCGSGLGTFIHRNDPEHML